MVTPQDVDNWLCWASKKLLAMPVSKIKPQEYRSYWPDMIQELSKFERLNHGNEAKRPQPPSKYDIPIMDQILLLPNICEDIEIRRILRLRSLIHPLRDNHIYSWVRIAKTLHSDRRVVARLHNKGLEQAAAGVDTTIAYRVTNHLSGVA